MRIIYLLVPLIFFINSCSKTDNINNTANTTTNTSNNEFQNTNITNSHEQVQETPPGDTDLRVYCEKLKYEELRLVHQAEDIREIILADPLQRKTRQPLFEQHNQIRTQLRDTQVAMIPNAA